MITLRGQILVSRIGDDPPSAPVCPSKTLSVFTFKTFPCVLAPSPHVSYMWAWCRHTRGRFESTHGKRFERVHGFFFTFFSPCRNTPNTHHHHNDTHHITQHGDRNRERQRKRDKTRQEKTRQDKKAREEKRRDEKEERRRRRTEKKKETMNRDKQFFRECPSAPELFSHQIPENVRQRRNYLAQMSEMSASTGIN